MVLGQLMEFAAGQEVATAVAGVGHEQPPVDGEGHRQRGPHAEHFGVPGSLLEDPCVGLQEGSLELLQDFRFFRFLQVEEPLERVQQEALDGHHAQGAGHFPGLMPAHAIGDDKQVSPVAAVLGLRLRHTRLVDGHDSGQLHDDEMVLVGRPYPSGVGQGEAPHREGALGVR
jgi:hypothetical protein